MQLKNKTIIVLIIFLPSVLTALALEVDNTKFISKHKEGTLNITNYQKLKEQKKKEAELSKIEAEKRRLLVESKKIANEKKRLKTEADNLKEQALKSAREAEIKRKQEEQRKKLAEKQAKLEEEKRRRYSTVKIVNLNKKDSISLESKKGEFYMEDYSELGVTEDTTSSIVDRDKIITTDMYIRALVQSNINTRRGGTFLASIERDVFSFESKKILLPKGSKIVCNFEPLEKFGESAVMTECSRVYFPNGKSMMLTSAVVGDQMARSGLVGDLDNRMWEKYGQTFMMSIISGLALFGGDKLPSSNMGSLSQYTGLSILDLSTQMLNKTIDLSPVVTIPSGSRIIITPTTDINLQPEEDK